MSDPAWYSVLPPVLAIVLAIWSKQVILSLFAGIWMGHTPVQSADRRCQEP
jgi:Na+/H+ antiporter NhaC